jgi:hypothetical protein
MTQIFPTPNPGSVSGESTMEGEFSKPAPAPGVIKTIITTGQSGTPSKMSSPLENPIRVKMSSKR